MSVIFHTKEAHNNNNVAKLQILSTYITSSDIICYIIVQAVWQHQIPQFHPATCRLEDWHMASLPRDVLFLCSDITLWK